MTISRADPAATQHARCDLAVLGAGPAGLAAAVTAASAGARVALIDAAPRPGGQYWRHRQGDNGASHHGWPVFQRLLRGLTHHADRIEYLPGRSVWHIERTAEEPRTGSARTPLPPTPSAPATLPPTPPATASSESSTAVQS